MDETKRNFLIASAAVQQGQPLEEVDEDYGKVFTSYIEAFNYLYLEEAERNDLAVTILRLALISPRRLAGYEDVSQYMVLTHESISFIDGFYIYYNW